MSEKEVLDWEEAQEKIEERYEKTEKLEFDFGDDTVVRFEVRGLSPEEYDKFEDKTSEIAQETQLKKKQMQNINFHGEQPKTKDQEKIVEFTKTFFIKHGIVESPEGFEATEENIKSLPPKIRNGLADAVNELTNLGIETRQGF